MNNFAFLIRCYSNPSDVLYCLVNQSIYTSINSLSFTLDISFCIRFSRYIYLTVLPVIITYKHLHAIITVKLLHLFQMSGDGEIRTLDPLLARQVLSQLSYTPISIWQPPAFPCRLQHSIIGRLGLNHRVRDGNGCVPQAHRHRKSFSYQERNTEKESSSYADLSAGADGCF